jgi:hypothetical protein
LPICGRIMASMSILVPWSTCRFEKTLDEVKNSNFLLCRVVRIKPKLVSDLGADAK